jgi:hypothetical protein
MDKPITLPPLAEIIERIRVCRDELAKLKKLFRLARAADDAAAARESRRVATAGGGERR